MLTNGMCLFFDPKKDTHLGLGLLNWHKGLIIRSKRNSPYVCHSTAKSMGYGQWPELNSADRGRSTGQASEEGT